MADRIVQELGFEATNGVQTIQKINVVLTQFNNNLGNAINRINELNRLTGKDTVKKFGDQASKGFDDVGRAADEMGKKGSKNVNLLTVSFQTLFRVVQTQIIVRAIAAIQAALRESVGDARDFQLAIGEVSTISAEKNIDTLSDSVTRLSNAYNVAAQDVASGLYQTLSNQIADTLPQQEAFLESVLRFSKVAVTSANDAGNLLAGVINAYGESAENADRITAKLFKTIELGRTTGKELASSLGRVIPIASQLGVSLDETLAALDDVTLGGVKTSEAVTQVRGSMNALLKPTQAMKQVLNDLGFDNGEQAIGALGYAGALRAVVNATDGTTTAISKLFPNIRGINAVLRIAKDEASQYDKALQGIRSVTIADLTDEFQRFASTDASTVTAALNEIRNIFREEFGNEVLKSAKALNDMKEPLKAIADGMAVLAKLTIGATGRLALFLEAAKDGGGTLEALGRGIRSLVTGYRPEQIEAIDKLAQSVSDLINASLRENETRLNETLDVNTRIAQSYNELQIEQRRTLNNRVRDAQEANQKLVNAEISGFKKILSAFDKFSNELNNKIAENERRRESSEDRSFDRKRASRSRQFDNRVSLFDPAQEVSARLRQSRTLSAEASRVAGDGTDAKAVERSQSILKEAEEQLKKAEDISKDLKGNDLVFKSRLEAERKLLDRRAEGIDKRVRTSVDSQNDAYREQGKIVAENKLRVLELLQVVKENQGELDKDGNPFTQRERGQRDQRANDARRQIIDITRSQLQSGKDFGFDVIAKALSKELTKTELDAITVTSQARTDLRRQVDDVFKDKFNLQLRISNFEEISDQIKDLAERRATRETRQATIDAQRQAIQSSSTGLLNRVGNEQIEGGFLTKAAQLLNRIPVFNGSVVAPDQLQARRDELARQAAGEDPNVTLARISRLVSQTSLSDAVPANAVPLLEQLANVAQQQGADPGDLATVRDSIERLANIFETQQKNRGPDAFGAEEEQRLKDLQARQKEFFDASVANTTDAGVKIVGVMDSVGESAFVQAGKLNTLRASIDDLTGGNQNKTPAAKDPREGFYGGLVRYFQNGGLNRGQDSISAKLRDGEMVLNPRAARNFYSQINPLNASQRVPERQSSGDTIYGDVSITIQESKSPDATVRELTKAISRERRRGTSRI